MAIHKSMLYRMHFFAHPIFMAWLNNACCDVIDFYTHNRLPSRYMRTTSAIICILALSGCDKRPENIPASIPVAATAQAPKKTISKDEREKIIAQSTAGFTLERDKMEKVSFYTPQSHNVLGDRLYTYISIPDDRPALLRVVPFYYGDEWIFYDQIKVMADDNIVYEKQFNYDEVRRDNSSGHVWETADYFALEDDIAALRKIAAAAKVTIRFSGREHRQDYDLTKQEIRNIGLTLTAFDKLKSL
jgi:hypothetical protein